MVGSLLPKLVEISVSSFFLLFETDRSDFINFRVTVRLIYAHPLIWAPKPKFVAEKYLGQIYYDDVIMGAMASQITSLTIVYSILYSDAYQRNHQSGASLACVQGIHRGPVNSPHKWPVTRKMFPFHDVIMLVPVLLAITECLMHVVVLLSRIKRDNTMLENNAFLWGLR